MRVKPFCILAMERSGTSWLVDLLDHHPEIHCTNDLLVGSPALSARKAITLKPDCRRFGFKILQWQNQSWLDHVMGQPSIPVILQWRMDVVRHLYSVLAAKESGVYHAKPFVQTAKDRLRNAILSLRLGQYWYSLFALRSLTRIGVQSIVTQRSYASNPRVIDLNTLEDFRQQSLRWVSECRDKLQVRGGPWMEVTYEDLVSEKHSSTIVAIQKFLDVHPCELKSEFRKLNREPLRDLVANYQEVRRYCLERSIPFA